MVGSDVEAVTTQAFKPLHKASIEYVLDTCILINEIDHNSLHLSLICSTEATLTLNNMMILEEYTVYCTSVQVTYEYALY